MLSMTLTSCNIAPRLLRTSLCFGLFPNIETVPSVGSLIQASSTSSSFSLHHSVQAMLRFLLYSHEMKRYLLLFMFKCFRNTIYFNNLFHLSTPLFLIFTLYSLENLGNSMMRHNIDMTIVMYSL